MHFVYLFLFFVALAVIPWLIGRGVSRWSLGLRHAPWILTSLAGCALVFQSLGSNSGSGTWSEVGDFLVLAAGASLCVAGLVAGVLTWRFPGKHLRHVGPSSAQRQGRDHHDGIQTEKPPTFALLRQRLEPDVSLQALIQAAKTVPYIQESDCRMIYPHAGILFRDLKKEDAVKLRGALKAQGIPVHLMEETFIDNVPQGRRVQALRLVMDALVETDMLGREHHHPFSRIKWCGAGRLEDSVYQEHEKIKTRVVHTMSGHPRMETYREKERGMEDLASLRFELLLSGEPWRLIWTCDEHQRRMLQGQPTGPGDMRHFETFLQQVRDHLPSARVSPSIGGLGRRPLWTYPSQKSFENEIRWVQACRKLNPGASL